MESGQRQPLWRGLGLLGRGGDSGPGLGPGGCERRLLWVASLLCVLLDLQLPGNRQEASAPPLYWPPFCWPRPLLKAPPIFSSLPSSRPWLSLML